MTCRHASHGVVLVFNASPVNRQANMPQAVIIDCQGKLRLSTNINPSPSAWARLKSLFLRASGSSHPSAILDSAPATAGDAARRMLAAGSGTIHLLRPEHCFEEFGKSGTNTWLFAPGEVVATRFEILRSLGRGGMGEIYEAIDRVKSVPVALKVILPNPLIDPLTAERLFRREFSVAQLVSHRNVCRIHDPYIHRRDAGQPILVVSMELLRGMTLGAVLGERGRLAVDEVAEIAKDLAAGIDAAHAAGVIHRDLKPANVIIVGENGTHRAVITDFGLARHTAAETVSRQSNAIAGTLRYMAPEQLEGRPDRLSDIYSFALILYELLTGELPFDGDSDLSLALNRLSFPPRDPATRTPGIPLAWRVALLRGLNRYPEQRFQSAGDLVRSVEHPASAVVLWPQLMANHVRFAPLLRPVAALLAFGAVLTLAFVLLKPQPGPLPSFSRILVSELRHTETTDRALAGATAILTAAIGQSPHLTVIRPAELRNTLVRMGKELDSPLDDTSLRELALRTGEAAVLFGAISRGREYSLHLRLETMSTDPRHAAASIDRTFEARNDQELFTAIATAANWVRTQSGEGSRERNEQNARPEDLTTGSWQALRLLQEAQARRASNDSEGALIFAREALDIDPGFAAAESFSADTHTDLRQYKEAFDGYRHALAMAKARNVTGRERYQIETNYEIDTGNEEDALATCRAWTAHFPLDYLPHFYGGFLSFHRGDFGRAVIELQRAEQLGPQQFAILPHLAAAFLAAGRREEARWCAGRLRDLGENEWALEVDGLVLLSDKRFEQAAAKIEPLARRGEGTFYWIGPRYMASALADCGRLHDAEQALLRGDANRNENSPAGLADRQLAVAFLRWLAGDSAGTRAALSVAAERLDNPDSLSLAGALFARIGDLQPARRILLSLSSWPNVPLVSRASERIRAEIELAAHPRKAHIPELGESFASPLDLEFLLHASITNGEHQRVERLRAVIASRKDILLSWDERLSPPGLYWLASCGSECRPQ